MNVLESQMSDTLSLLETDIPVLSTMQRQGDVLIVPIDLPSYGLFDAKRWLNDVPEDGMVLAEGGQGGHQHRLFASQGNVRCRTSNGDRAATLFVDENSSAILAHDEHAYLGIGPGVYEVRRQREHTGIAPRRVTD